MMTKIDQKNTNTLYAYNTNVYYHNFEIRAFSVLKQIIKLLY